MRFLISAVASLLFATAAIAQTSTPKTTTKTNAVTAGSKTTASPVPKASPATQKSLPVEARGITITTPKLVYALQRS